MNAPRRKPPLLIIRLWEQHHSDESVLEALLAQIARHPGCCDEVWFTTMRGFPPMAVHRESARQMAEAAQRVRETGVLPGLQIGWTLGHGDSRLCRSDGIDWQRIVGPDGREAEICNCPRDPRFLDYCRQRMRLYAAWGPSSVWIDDDVRMHHHRPVMFGCFCDGCLAAFAAEQGRAWSRAALAAALNDPDGGRVRLAWTAFNGRSLAIVARATSEAVHEVAPQCRMGFQHCSHDRNLYDGPDYGPVFEAMAEATGLPVGSRAGCGCYDDHAPREMIRKACAVAGQVARLPDCVDTACPEIENFTHNAMGKTAHGTVVESTLDLGVGCNCLSYAILCSGHEPMEWYGQTLLARLAAWRPFWRRYVDANEGSTPGGLEFVFARDHVGRRLRPDERPFAWNRPAFEGLYPLATLGLPLCFDASAASGALLCAEAVEGLTDEQIHRRLAGGVLMDGAAAMRVQERGFGELLGVRVEPFGPLDAFERLTDDPANGPHAGAEWHVFFTSEASPIYRLEPTGEGVRVLGEYVDISGRACGTATALAENEAGGRIAVLAFDGFEHVVSSPRRGQLLAAADWISRGRLPVLIETPAQVVALPRVDGEGRLRSVMLLNATIDRTPPLELRLRAASADGLRWIRPLLDDCKPAVRRAGGDLCVGLAALEPWSVGWLGGPVTPLG